MPNFDMFLFIPFMHHFMLNSLDWVVLVYFIMFFVYLM